MLIIRRIHNYLGLLIAPSVLFFAVSGALQIFSLHEAHGNYRPPALIKALGNLHKDQVLFRVSEHTDRTKPPIMEMQAAPVHHDHLNDARATTLALKWFFELVAAGLATSTLLGAWIGLKFTRTKLLSWGLLGAGIAIPLIVLIL